MSVIDTVRPTSVRKTGSGTSVPSGTLSAVTSDDSDSTYIDFDLVNTGNNWSLRVASHTPSSGYQRHQIRGRIKARSNTGTISEDIDLGRGSDDYYGYDTVYLTSSLAEYVTPWFQSASYGLNTAGALSDINIGGGWPANEASGATEVRTAECYVDIDCRYRPDFSPEIRDNAGVDQTSGTVSDTNQPVLYFGAVAYDGLPSLDWTVDLKSGGVTVYSTTGSGIPPASLPGPSLANGSYTVTYTVRSTIRGSDPFAYSETLSFDVENIVPPPSPPLLTVTEQDGGYLVSWEDPGGQIWDNDYVVAEVYREDCNGTQRIATLPDALNGSYLDLAIPQLDPILSGVDCEPSSEPCDITYSVRYLGYVSTFVELPDSIPDDLILAWPGTAASIPSGWSRVTALDGRFPRGATGTGAPTATGGSTSHLHTTPGHNHLISAHSHSLGGNSGSSSSSVTSARYNGAGQAQANQPHSHALPLNTVSHPGGYSGITAPGTDTETNTPPTYEVIWIQSDGARTEYPIGVLGWATEAVSGWTDDATSSGRFLKGAAAAGNGGSTSGFTGHSHSVESHSHLGFSHSHSIAGTGLSNPLSSVEAGYGSSTPRYLPRHTHPITVSSASTGNMNNNSGGTTSIGESEPLNRRLRVLRNTGGGIQTRIIGLYLGTVASLDPLLTLCNGSNGTPDMRGWFARDKGSDSVNSTGGAATHTHTVGPHVHSFDGHRHDTTIGTSTTGSYERATFGDLGDNPSTSHTHSSGFTDYEDPGAQTVSITGANSADHTPPYREAHFVRLDGTISGGPLPVPELKVSEYASTSVPSLAYDDGLDRLASLTTKVPVVTDRSHEFPRLVADSTPLQGGLHSVSTTLAGENVTLTIAVEGVEAINELEALLSEERLYWSPLGGTAGWFAPAGWTVRAPAPDVKVVQVTMVRQPWPETDDPEVYL